MRSDGLQARPYCPNTQSLYVVGALAGFAYFFRCQGVAALGELPDDVIGNGEVLRSRQLLL